MADDEQFWPVMSYDGCRRTVVGDEDLLVAMGSYDELRIDMTGHARVWTQRLLLRLHTSGGTGRTFLGRHSSGTRGLDSLDTVPRTPGREGPDRDGLDSPTWGTVSLKDTKEQGSDEVKSCLWTPGRGPRGGPWRQSLCRDPIQTGGRRGGTPVTRGCFAGDGPVWTG